MCVCVSACISVYIWCVQMLIKPIQLPMWRSFGFNEPRELNCCSEVAFNLKRLLTSVMHNSCHSYSLVIQQKMQVFKGNLVEKSVIQAQFVCFILWEREKFFVQCMYLYLCSFKHSTLFLVFEVFVFSLLKCLCPYTIVVVVLRWTDAESLTNRLSRWF